MMCRYIKVKKIVQASKINLNLITFHCKVYLVPYPTELFPSLHRSQKDMSSRLYIAFTICSVYRIKH